MPATIERYIFDAASNFEAGRDTKKQPQMVNRFISGVLHPLIHAGHALEFASPGMLAEGSYIQNLVLFNVIKANLIKRRSSNGVHATNRF